MHSPSDKLTLSQLNFIILLDLWPGLLEKFQARQPFIIHLFLCHRECLFAKYHCEISTLVSEVSQLPHTRILLPFQFHPN